MARIDSLPPEQKAVLQLILQQGKSYGELSGLLRIDESAVRRRAHAATAALGPDDTPGLTPARRDEIADFLLGQGSEADRGATREMLGGSAAGRAWARVVAGELRPLAGDALPEIPSERRDAAAAAAPPAVTAAAGEPAAPAAAAGSRAPIPRSSRLGGALLIGVVVVVIGVVLVVALGGGSDNKSPDKADTATTAAQTSTTGQAQVKDQVNLTAPAGAPAKKAIGVVQVVDVSGKQAINAVVQGLPRTKKAGYGIWLYTSPSRKEWLGYFSSADQQGRLIAQGELKQSLDGYKEMLVTRESRRDPAQPGTIFLRGPIKAAP
jgi:hypothetical protein